MTTAVITTDTMWVRNSIIATSFLKPIAMFLDLFLEVADVVLQHAQSCVVTDVVNPRTFLCELTTLKVRNFDVDTPKGAVTLINDVRDFLPLRFHELLQF